MKFTVYDRATGELVRVGEGPSSAVQSQKANPDHVVFEGAYASTHRYDPAEETLKPLFNWRTGTRN